MRKVNDKWYWMMDYCKEHGLPPAQSFAWNRAEEEYLKHTNKDLSLAVNN